MANKESGEVFQIDDLRGVITNWLKDDSSNPEDYITKVGMGHANGYCEASNTIALIKIEKYNVLLAKYEELINKYDKSKTENDKMKEHINKLYQSLKEEKNRKSWFSKLF